jgi:hypothetical protein
MAPQPTANTKHILYALLALGFAGLIGAHEWASMTPSPSGPLSETGSEIGPLILAGLGTLSFVAAGLLARKLMKGGGSPQ